MSFSFLSSSGMSKMLIQLLVPLLCVGLSHQANLHFYIAAVEVDWDYAPSGINGITGDAFDPDSTAAKYVLGGPDRIGSVYKKALYREFTNDTFTVQKPHPEWLGTLGPILRAEVKDILHIHFKNLASRPYTMHPHGVFYDKNSEGALYQDGTSGDDKRDDGVPPGGTYNYLWEVPTRAGPSRGDSGCVSWQYHSHIESPLGTNTGLVGPMVICRQAVLKPDGSRVDVDKEFFLMVTTFDENLSYYIQDNIKTYCDVSSVDQEDEGFLDSNKMRSINGYVYGNLPGLEVCVGEKIVWHIFGMGTEIDVHTITFTGNELVQNNHRRDVFGISPAAIFNTIMRPRNTGTWLITSNVINHIEAGLQALYTVRSDCGWEAVERPLMGQIREYFIGAVNTSWNYAPTGMNTIYRTSLTDPTQHENTYFESSPERIGGTYLKYRYLAYSDDTFSRRMRPQPDEIYLGILGPLIRAEVGDTIRVHFKNMASHPLNIHASGVAYNKSNEGIKYNDGTSGRDKEDDEVAPGGTYIYEWTVPEHVGPTDDDLQCLTRIYRSTVDSIRDYNSGLIGPLVICRQGTLDQNGKQMNVDREYFLLFAHFDENESWLTDDNIRIFAPEADPEDAGFIESNQMYAINGWSYANIPSINACLGDTISWHLAGFGQATDHHSAYFTKGSFNEEGRTQDQLSLLPGMSGTVHMLADNIGEWSFACLTVDHHDNGLIGCYNVSECGRQDPVPEREPVRTHYIAAVEVEWDYAPVHFDPVRNQSLDDPDSEGHVFVSRGDTFIGSRYKKILYREFTDETFQEEKDRPVDWGFLGPPIYIEVDETIKIVFKNMGSRPHSIHAHGIDYTATIENPTKGDSSHAGVLDYQHDLYSGLVGPLLVCKKGALRNGARNDVDRELFLFFIVSDENRSWYLQENIDTYCLDPSSVDVTDGDFVESNLMHGINGYIYSNLKGLTMKKGEKVEWYLLGMGNEVDLHSVHFHGQTIVYRKEQPHRADVFELFPGLYSALRMVPDNPGEWLLHCHVNDHILGGMETTFTVLSSSSTGL
ncbi:putative hephaestin-like protein 1 [Apostichopus japonicus]|uniref:Putative hephaestin-like protein 1 n=1 Tax=Stichopus japonicus TaxID=307972 RepID=A0A2G8LGD3_STIJA|nr:putative hephaestin-like protein 1 [Apostichopus japonicus]